MGVMASLIAEPMHAPRKYPLYAISGISGSGKTTLGRMLAPQIRTPDGTNCVFVDQDQFYIKDKPLVLLSNGKTVRNWDTVAALNRKMCDIINAMLDQAPVVLVGFLLSRSVLATLQPTVHIHLVLAHNPADLSARCKEARIRAKPGMNPDTDALVVDEVVIPRYRETVAFSDITHWVPVYQADTGLRRTPDELLVQLLDIIDTDAFRPTTHYMHVSEPYHTLIGVEDKPVEGRKLSETWRKVRKGDEIVMACGVTEEAVDRAPHGYGEGHVFTVRVTGVRCYLSCFGDPLGRYLREETLARTLPGVTTEAEGRAVYLQWFSQSDIDRLGMVAFQVEVVFTV